MNRALNESSGSVAVCFRRGDIFRGNLAARSNVTLTAYGIGGKPVICGSPENGAEPGRWEKVPGTENIWKYKTPLRDVGTVFFDGGRSYAAKRCPSVIGGSYEYGYEALENLQFISAVPAGDAISLNNSNAAEKTGYLYLRCDEGNPGEIYQSVEFSERVYVISLADGSENITIDNLCITFGGAHGIAGSNIKNLLVQNCELSFIGGGIQKYNYDSAKNAYIPARYGNGVEVNTSCDGYTVRSCFIHDIYDAGITHQVGNNHTADVEFNNVEYSGNLIENCTYSVEYFARPSVAYENGSSNAGTAEMNNILIKDNIMRFAGFGFGEQRTLTDWNMAAHIMGWNNSRNVSNGFIVESNVMDRCVYSNPSSAAKINSSFILVSAEKTEYLPEFKGNTYVHYSGSRFSYYGEYALADFNASCFTKFGFDTDVGELLGDLNGKICVLEQPGG